MKVKRTMNWIGLIFAASILFGFVQMAMAGGTPAGTDITNSATATYEVGGDPRSASGEVTFYVDNMVNLSVERVDASYVTVVMPSGNTTTGMLTFRVTNNGNAIQDYVFQLEYGSDPFGGTANFEAGFDLNKVFVDKDLETGDGNYVEAEDTANFIDELEPDKSVIVYVVASIPVDRSDGSALVDGDISAITLTAITHDGGAAGEGSETAQDGGANTDAEQVVFVDTGRDGKDSITGAFKVQAAALSVNKWVNVIDDPLNPSNPKAIPGSTLEYTIKVQNNGNAQADSIIVSDDLTDEISNIEFLTDGYSASSGEGIKVYDNATTTTDYPTNSSADTDGGEWNSNIIKVSIDSLAAGEFVRISFKVKIR